MQKNNRVDQTPEIYCAVGIFFDKNIEISSVIDSLKQIGITQFKVSQPKYDPIICLDIAIVDYEAFWYLNDALTKMFSKIDNFLVDLKEVIKKYGGEVKIDIAFYQYGTYPALEFMGANMKKIHFLDADISIDPY